MADSTQYKRVKDAQGIEYLCNIDFLGTQRTDLDGVEECFEADVAGRYASNIKVSQ